MSQQSHQLPTSSKRLTAWPWAAEPYRAPLVMPNGRAWPRLSIITPSFNQGRFIEETIRSVLLQGYPNLEYFVLDGGSTDESVTIIKKYERWLSGWRSGSDGGQAAALASGFGDATGEILGWINSDDTYEPNAFITVAEHFRIQSDAGVVSGRCGLLKDGIRTLNAASILRTYDDFLSVGSKWMRGFDLAQPATFFTAEAYKRSGGINPNLHYCFDVDLWMRMAKAGETFFSCDQHLATAKLHRGQKTADITSANIELCRLALSRAIADRELLADPFTTLSDIATAFDALIHQLRTRELVLRASSSYRLANFVMQAKFW